MNETRTAPVHFIISVFQPRYVQTLVEELESIPAEFRIPLILHCSADAFPASWTPRGRGKSAQPADPVQEIKSEKLRRSIQDLMDQGFLSLLPAGFTGAPHVVLSQEEARLDAEWALANPWKSGLSDRFSAKFPRLLPYWTDATRAGLNLAILGMYSSLGLGTMNLPSYGRCMIFQTPSGFEFIPMLRLSHVRTLRNFAPTYALGARIKKVIRTIPQSPAGKPGLIVHLPWLPQTGSILHLFKLAKSLEQHGIAPRMELQTLPVSVLKTAPEFPRDAASLSPWGPGLPVLGAETRQRLIKLSEVRQSRSSVAERVRSQLVQARPASMDHPDYAENLPLHHEELLTDMELTPVEFAKSLPKALQRGLISAMQGSATMMADNFSIRFHEGQAQAFMHQQDEILFAPVLDKVFQGIRRHSHLESDGSVAFESDRIRGLRHNLVINPEGSALPGKYCIDYVLSDRTGYLLMDVFIRYPWFKQDCIIPSLSPLTLEIKLSLDSLGDQGITLDWRNADSSPNSLKLFSRSQEAEGSFYCPGSHWTLTWATKTGNIRGLDMRRMNAEEKKPAPMTLEWQLKGRNLSVFIKPEGVWKNVNCKELRGLHHHWTMALHPLFADQAPPELEALAERDFEPFYLYQDAGETSLAEAAAGQHPG